MLFFRYYMEGRRPISGVRKYGDEMYGGRSSYLRSNEHVVNSDDEDDLRDSLEDKGLFALWF